MKYKDRVMVDNKSTGSVKEKRTENTETIDRGEERKHAIDEMSICHRKMCWGECVYDVGERMSERTEMKARDKRGREREREKETKTK